MTIINISEECLSQNHPFQEILTHNHGWDGSCQVVYWCERCGSIRITLDDLEDGRVYSSKIFNPRIN